MASAVREPGHARLGHPPGSCPPTSFDVACTPQTDLTGVAATGATPATPAGPAGATLVDPAAGATGVPLNLAGVVVRFSGRRELANRRPRRVQRAGRARCRATAPADTSCPDGAGGACYRVDLAGSLPPSTACAVSIAAGAVDASGAAVTAGDDRGVRRRRRARCDAARSVGRRRRVGGSVPRGRLRDRRAGDRNPSSSGPAASRSTPRPARGRPASPSAFRSEPCHRRAPRPSPSRRPISRATRRLGAARLHDTGPRCRRSPSPRCWPIRPALSHSRSTSSCGIWAMPTCRSAGLRLQDSKGGRRSAGRDSRGGRLCAGRHRDLRSQ